MINSINQVLPKFFRKWFFFIIILIFRYWRMISSRYYPNRYQIYNKIFKYTYSKTRKELFKFQIFFWENIYRVTGNSTWIRQAVIGDLSCNQLSGQNMGIKIMVIKVFSIVRFFEKILISNMIKFLNNGELYVNLVFFFRKTF